MNIETYGSGERLMHAARLSSSLCAKHLVLLPVPTTRDGMHVTGTDIPLTDALSNVASESTVFGYAIPESYKDKVEEVGARVVDLAEDEEFLLENAILTAIGAVGYLLTSSKRAIKGLHVGIVGYGRIGSSLTDLLLFFGARVRVYTSKMLTRVELGESGVESRLSDELYSGRGDIEELDVLINTAPRDMRTAFSDGKIPFGKRVLELASGKNFEGICGVEYLPGIPEKYYPESAGDVYYSAILKHVERSDIK